MPCRHCGTTRALKTETIPLTDDGDARASIRRGAYLVLAFDSRRPLGPVSRFSLAETDAVVAGRAAARGATRSRVDSQRQLRIDVDDGSMSTAHFRLTASGSGVWVMNDDRSKNGTRVNGTKRPHCELVDGDVIEAGHTQFVFRDVGLATADALEVQALPTDPPSLVTMSAELRQAYDSVARIARSKVPMITYGESGTGKEIIAQALHQMSGRSGRFVAVNCGAISKTLIEAELFGAEKGAFSGRDGAPRGAGAGIRWWNAVPGRNRRSTRLVPGHPAARDSGARGAPGRGDKAARR